MSPQDQLRERIQEALPEEWWSFLGVQAEELLERFTNFELTPDDARATIVKRFPMISLWNLWMVLKNPAYPLIALEDLGISATSLVPQIIELSVAAIQKKNHWEKEPQGGQEARRYEMTQMLLGLLLLQFGEDSMVADFSDHLLESRRFKHPFMLTDPYQERGYIWEQTRLIAKESQRQVAMRMRDLCQEVPIPDVGDMIACLIQEVKP